jgi:nitric oxide reductase NorD protein
MLDFSQRDTAAVWLWLVAGPAQTSHSTPQAAQKDAVPQPNTVTDRQRRRTQKASEKNDRTAMVLPSRGESIMTWSDMVNVNRSTDDEPDANALNVANDMDRLVVSPDGQTLASRVKFDLDLPSSSADDQPLGPGVTLPEWDYRKGRLLPAHCLVQVMQIREAAPFTPSPALRLTAKRVRRKLETLRDAPRPLLGQDSGDDIDLDAWVRFNTDMHSASGMRTDTPPIYTRRTTSERSLATLLLADLSLSTDAYATPQAKVIDVIRDALLVFGEALQTVDDPFAVWGFSSVRRSHVRLQHLKHFDEPWNDASRARIGAIKPGYYTRMGAAIRYATMQLASRPERRRLLMLLTDGKPNDLDIYEGRYGLEDTRAAVHEAHAAGLSPFCVTIDEKAHDYLPTLFGQHGYTMVRRPQDLVNQLTRAWTTLSRR